MTQDSDCEEREALVLVARDVVLEPLRPGVPEGSPGDHLGLAGFAALAVVDHLRGTPDVLVASDEPMAAAVALEGDVGEGPATDAVESGGVVVCRDLEHERRWPTFSARAVESGLGLRRWMAVPLSVPGERPMGSVVLASAAAGIITPDELAAAGALADRCSLALTARIGVGREARAVLASDTVRLVGLAVGVVMATEGLGEEQALARLRVRSAVDGCRLVDAAVAVLTERDLSFR